MPLTAHRPGCQGRAVPLSGGRNMKHRETQSSDNTKCKYSKNTSATVCVACTVALLCQVTATTFSLQLHLTRTQLSSLGPSQHGQTTLTASHGAADASLSISPPFPPHCRSVHLPTAAEWVQRARGAISSPLTSTKPQQSSGKHLASTTEHSSAETH